MNKMLTEMKMEELSVTLEQSPQKLLRCFEQETGVSKSST
jgi:transcriptional regulator GlxA family with amidase domain